MEQVHSKAQANEWGLRKTVASVANRFFEVPEWENGRLFGDREEKSEENLPNQRYPAKRFVQTQTRLQAHERGVCALTAIGQFLANARQ